MLRLGGRLLLRPRDADLTVGPHHQRQRPVRRGAWLCEQDTFFLEVVQLRGLVKHGSILRCRIGKSDGFFTGSGVVAFLNDGHSFAAEVAQFGALGHELDEVHSLQQGELVLNLGEVAVALLKHFLAVEDFELLHGCRGGQRLHRLESGGKRGVTQRRPVLRLLPRLDVVERAAPGLGSIRRCLALDRVD